MSRNSIFITSDSTIICCKDCKERHVGCHSSCKKYAEEKQAYERFKEEERKRRVPQSVYEQKQNTMAMLVRRGKMKKNKWRGHI